jgi:hypothetical protein
MPGKWSAITVAVLSFAVAARAEETAPPSLEAARAHFDAGLAAYQAGDFPTAIREYDAANALVPAPQIDYHLGHAYQAMGDCPTGAEHFRRFLAAVPDAPERAEVEARSVCPGTSSAPAATVAPPPMTSPPPTATAQPIPITSATRTPSSPGHAVWRVFRGILIGVAVVASLALIVLLAVAVGDGGGGSSHHVDHHFLGAPAPAPGNDARILFRF